jgi:hypothetical protein
MTAPHNSQPVTGWAVKHWNCGLYVDTIRRTRAESIASFKEQFGLSDEEWADDRKYGIHKPVRVITELRP